MNARQTLARLEEADPRQHVVVKLPIETTIGAHSVVDDLVNYGRVMCNLSVEHVVSGGWFSKSHYIKAEGTVGDMKKFCRAQMSMEDAFG